MYGNNRLPSSSVPSAGPGLPAASTPSGPSGADAKPALKLTQIASTAASQVDEPALVMQGTPMNSDFCLSTRSADTSAESTDTDPLLARPFHAFRIDELRVMTALISDEFSARLSCPDCVPAQDALTFREMVLAQVNFMPLRSAFPKPPRPPVSRKPLSTTPLSTAPLTDLGAQEVSPLSSVNKQLGVAVKAGTFERLPVLAAASLKRTPPVRVDTETWLEVHEEFLRSSLSYITDHSLPRKWFQLEQAWKNRFPGTPRTGDQLRSRLRVLDKKRARDALEAEAVAAIAKKIAGEDGSEVRSQ
jgi:hypothetical protein